MKYKKTQFLIFSLFFILSFTYSIPAFSADTSGLVSLWSGDGNAKDSQGSNDGIIVGNVTCDSQGKIDKACKFDGNSEITIPLNDSLLSNKAMMAWIKPTAGLSSAAIIEHTGHYSIFLKDQQFAYKDLSTGDVREVGTSKNIPVDGNSWTHIAVSENLSGNSVKVYINGDLVDTISRALGGTLTGDIHIGKDTSNPGFSGLADQIGVLNRPLTDDEVSTRYAAENNTSTSEQAGTCTPIHHWSMEGNNRDFIGGLDMAHLGGLKYQDDMMGKALLFDGVYGYAEIPHKSSVDITGDMSMSVWVKPLASQGKAYTVLSKRGNDDSDYTDPYQIILDDRNNKKIVRFLMGPGTGVAFNEDNTLEASHAYRDGEWVYIEVTVKGNDMTLYINGEKKDYGTFIGTRQSNNMPIRLGMYPPEGILKFKGLMDELIIYNCALSHQQIQSIPDSLVGYWDGNSNLKNQASLVDSRFRGSSSEIDRYDVGVSGMAFNLNGINDDIEAIEKEGESAFNPVDSLTVSAWMYPRSVHRGMIIAKASLWAIGVNETGKMEILARVADENNNELRLKHIQSSELPYTINKWTHVAMTIGNSKLKVYMDGNLLFEEAFEGKIKSGTNPVIIGYRRWVDQQHHFNGKLDEIKVYNKLLDAREIKSIYDTGVKTLFLSRFTKDISQLIEETTNLFSTHTATRSVVSEEVCSGCGPEYSWALCTEDTYASMVTSDLDIYDVDSIRLHLDAYYLSVLNCKDRWCFDDGTCVQTQEAPVVEYCGQNSGSCIATCNDQCIDQWVVGMNSCREGCEDTYPNSCDSRTLCIGGCLDAFVNPGCFSTCYSNCQTSQCGGEEQDTTEQTSDAEAEAEFEALQSSAIQQASDAFEMAEQVQDAVEAAVVELDALIARLTTVKIQINAALSDINPKFETARQEMWETSTGDPDTHQIALVNYHNRKNVKDWIENLDGVYALYLEEIKELKVNLLDKIPQAIECAEASLASAILYGDGSGAAISCSTIGDDISPSITNSKNSVISLENLVDNLPEIGSASDKYVESVDSILDALSKSKKAKKLAEQVELFSDGMPTNTPYSIESVNNAINRVKNLFDLAEQSVDEAMGLASSANVLVNQANNWTGHIRHNAILIDDKVEYSISQSDIVIDTGFEEAVNAIDQLWSWGPVHSTTIRELLPITVNPNLPERKCGVPSLDIDLEVPEDLVAKNRDRKKPQGLMTRLTNYFQPIMGVSQGVKQLWPFAIKEGFAMVTGVWDFNLTEYKSFPYISQTSYVELHRRDLLAIAKDAYKTLMRVQSRLDTSYETHQDALKWAAQKGQISLGLLIQALDEGQENRLYAIVDKLDTGYGDCWKERISGMYYDNSRSVAVASQDLLDGIDKINNRIMVCDALIKYDEANNAFFMGYPDALLKDVVAIAVHEFSHLNSTKRFYQRSDRWPEEVFWAVSSDRAWNEGGSFEQINLKTNEYYDQYMVKELLVDEIEAFIVEIAVRLAMDYPVTNGDERQIAELLVNSGSRQVAIKGLLYMFKTDVFLGQNYPHIKNHLETLIAENENRVRYLDIYAKQIDRDIDTGLGFNKLNIDDYSKILDTTTPKALGIE